MKSASRVWPHWWQKCAANSGVVVVRGLGRVGVQGLLQGLGHFRAGQADLGHELTQFGGILRQFLRPEEDECQDRENKEFRNIDTQGNLTQADFIPWPQWGQKAKSPPSSL